MADHGAALTYLDGCILDEGLFVLSARNDALPAAYDDGQILWHHEGSWSGGRRGWQAGALCRYRPTAGAPPGCMALESVTGRTAFYPQGAAPTRELLPEPAEMTDIVQAGQDLYACGTGGKVFRRTSGKWESFNEGLRALTFGDHLKRGLPARRAMAASKSVQRNLLAIGGLGPGSLVCAGRQGLLFWHDEEVWRRMERRTEADLAAVLCVDESLAYAAGKSGTLLCGGRNGFEVLSTGAGDDFTSLAWFNDRLYIGGRRGIYRLERQALVRVDTGHAAGFGCVALDAHAGQLLAVGAYQALVFDGREWLRVDDPCRDVNLI